MTQMVKDLHIFTIYLKGRKMTALMWCALRGLTEIAQELIQSGNLLTHKYLTVALGCKLEFRELECGWTAAHCAAVSGSTGVMQVLIKYYAFD